MELLCENAIKKPKCRQQQITAEDASNEISKEVEKTGTVATYHTRHCWCVHTVKGYFAKLWGWMLCWETASLHITTVKATSNYLNWLCILCKGGSQHTQKKKYFVLDQMHFSTTFFHSMVYLIRNPLALQPNTRWHSALQITHFLNYTTKCINVLRERYSSFQRTNPKMQWQVLCGLESELTWMETQLLQRECKANQTLPLNYRKEH